MAQMPIGTPVPMARASKQNGESKKRVTVTPLRRVTAMNIELSSALRRYVYDQVKGGRFLDASDVVRAALRRMEAQGGALGAQLHEVADGDIMTMAFLPMGGCRPERARRPQGDYGGRQGDQRR
jgi:putative addiction module CopG family antidote